MVDASADSLNLPLNFITTDDEPLEPLRFSIPPELQDARLDKALTVLATPLCSRERLKHLILTGCVSVNQQPITKPSFKLTALPSFSEIQLFLPPDEPLNMPPYPVALDVLFEDDHLLVVNKPCGMLTHPTGRRQTDTLVNALLHHCQGQLSSINGVIRPGIVHRLDRDTEGLLVVAKTNQAHQQLAQQLKTKTMRREYYAIVQGAFTHQEGLVDLPIGRHPQHRQKMMVNPTYTPARNALTHWQVLETLHDKFAWVHCQLATGRTHQIRVHLTAIGHPLVGDVLYGTGLANQWKLLETEAGLLGQALQAFRLSLVHPVTSKTLVFECPKSERLQKTWAVLTAHLNV
jgi:23S rRNA pseudouridine1911/1915/1917 synthase